MQFSAVVSQGLYGNGKTEFQDYSRTFFIFQRLNFFQILYIPTRKKEMEIEKWHTCFPVIKTGTTAQIE